MMVFCIFFSSAYKSGQSRVASFSTISVYAKTTSRNPISTQRRLRPENDQEGSRANSRRQVSLGMSVANSQ